VNGTAVKCGATTLPPSKGGYYYFEIGAGGHTWDAIHLNAAQGVSCTPPAGSGTAAGGSSGVGGKTGAGGAGTGGSASNGGSTGTGTGGSTGTADASAGG
jgi:hypothetical protein